LSNDMTSKSTKKVNDEIRAEPQPPEAQKKLNNDTQKADYHRQISSQH